MNCACPGGRGAGEQSDPSRVAQRRTDPSVRKGIAVAVDSDLRVVLGTHGLPSSLVTSSLNRAWPAFFRTQASTSVRTERYSKVPTCGQSLTSVAKNSSASAGRGLPSSGRHNYTRSLTAMSPSESS